MRRLSSCLQSLALLAILSTFGCAAKVEGPKPPEPNAGEVTEPTGFVAVRAASVLKKLRCPSLEKHPLCTQFASQFGMPLTALDRIMLVGYPHGETLEILDADKDFPRPAVLKACLKEWKDIKVGNRTLHVGKNQTLCFLTDQRAILGSHDRVKELTKADVMDQFPLMQAALTQAGDSDVVVHAYGPVLHVSEALRKMSLESALATVHFGDTVDLQLKLTTLTPEGATNLAKYTRGFINLARGQFLMIAGFEDAAEVLPDIGSFPTEALPFDLIRKVEKGLEQATVRSEKNTATAKVSLPLDSASLRKELERGLVLLGDEQCENCFGFLMPKCQADPLVAPPPVFEGRLPEPTPIGTPVMSPPLSATTASRPVAFPPSQIPPMPTEVILTTASAPTPRGPVKWTVANLRKEEISLFEMNAEGKMTFKQKLAPSEAIDMTGTGETRWIAFSPLGQQADSFTPKAEGVWLLRPVPGAPVAAPGSYSVPTSSWSPPGGGVTRPTLYGQGQPVPADPR